MKSLRTGRHKAFRLVVLFYGLLLGHFSPGSAADGYQEVPIADCLWPMPNELYFEVSALGRVMFANSPKHKSLPAAYLRRSIEFEVAMRDELDSSLRLVEDHPAFKLVMNEDGGIENEGFDIYRLVWLPPENVTGRNDMFMVYIKNSGLFVSVLHYPIETVLYMVQRCLDTQDWQAGGP